MREIVLVDTSIVCELIRLPGKFNEARHEDVRELFAIGQESGDVFVLPMATVVETGNHVGQVGDGALRRRAAEAFSKLLLAALDDAVPWLQVIAWDEHTVGDLADGFVAWATNFGSGIGDFSIVRDYEALCRRHKYARVRVWSLDRHLASFDRNPG
jgi:predicted nucleic acid-binding protein